MAVSTAPARQLRVIFYCDFPPESIVKIVGSIPELGDWNVARAPELKYEDATSSFVGTLPIRTAVGEGSTIEYKMVVRKPADSRTAAWHEDAWEWQPDPNRRVVVTSHGTSPSASGASTPVPASSTKAAPAVPGIPVVPRKAEGPRVISTLIKESWYHARDGTQVISSDPYLEPFRGALQSRYRAFEHALATISSNGGGLDAFSRGWEYYGFNRGTTEDGRGCIIYREWAPHAIGASLIGDFNGWDATKHPCSQNEFGVFTCVLPDLPDGRSAIPHDSFVKVSLRLPEGTVVTRIPAWIKYAVYDKTLNEYCGKYWDPPEEDRHVWRHSRQYTFTAADYCRVPGVERLSPAFSHESDDASHATSTGSGNGNGKPAEDGGSSATHRRGRTGMDAVRVAERRSAFARPAPCAVQYDVNTSKDPARAGLRIYEAHVGMGGEEERVFKYREFADTVLPRIKRLGYNCVQLMAIMEHAYYGSFGYHVTSFHAASSRFGTPEDLKYLVDTAHEMGLLVIMDLVHSHAAKNVNDGLNMFDGTDYQYFHGGARGNHDLWDSRLFDYSKFEVQRFLLSSARFYIEEYRFDGYRFDGVTSMMYHHHGMGVGFSGGYHEYFGESTDMSAVVYLMLANYMLHSMSPPVLTIAEDVSGMPTLCRPVVEGGVGFDYRLAMAIPDKWIQVLKEKRDEEWDIGNIAFTLINRRWQEKTIAYAESHDQALVGDKTLAFWLMDKEMYWNMSTLTKPIHPVIDRGLALHKMIRLVTYGLGGEAYLNFMGNEFGHPEWIDFPREGNGWSYKHCRRQWHLVDDPLLHYKHLNAFDGAMHALEDQFPWLISHDNFVSLKHEGDKMLVFERGTNNGPLVFIVNFHPSQSFEGYRVGVPCSGDWVVALDSDWSEFGGYDRVARDASFPSQNMAWCDRPHSIQVYSPCRTIQVLKLRTA